MNLGKTDGGPPAEPAVEKISATAKQLDRGQGTSARVAEGVFYPPAGRRHLGVVVVRGCPGCGHMHLHRAESSEEITGAARTGSCGAAYRVELVASDAPAALAGALATT